jgi:hypothetical protein
VFIRANPWRSCSRKAAELRSAGRARRPSPHNARPHTTPVPTRNSEGSKPVFIRSDSWRPCFEKSCGAALRRTGGTPVPTRRLSPHEILRDRNPCSSVLIRGEVVSRKAAELRSAGRAGRPSPHDARPHTTPVPTRNSKGSKPVFIRADPSQSCFEKTCGAALRRTGETPVPTRPLSPHDARPHTTPVPTRRPCPQETR